jgi:hypothetical protein
MENVNSIPIKELNGFSNEDLISWLENEGDLIYLSRKSYIAHILSERGDVRSVRFLLEIVQDSEKEGYDFHVAFCRGRALIDLAELNLKEYKGMFLDIVINDPQEEVKQMALNGLTTMFRSNRDVEILRVSLKIFQDTNMSVPTRLSAGATLLYQFEESDTMETFDWWNENPEYLNHPDFLWAAEEAKKIING